MKFLQKKQAFFIPICILVLALGLRLPLLNGSFWLDEAAQALESTRPLNQQLQIRDDFQPPLLHLIVHFFARVSHSEAWLRTGAALIPGLITIVIVYLLAEKKYHQRVAILTTLLLSLSSFHVFYSQELRQYSLPAMWAALSWWWLLRDSQAKTKLKKFDWQLIIGFSIFSVAGWYSSYLYPFVFAAQIFYLLVIARQKIREAVITTGIVAASFSIWLPSFLGQLQAGQELQKTLPGWSAVVGFSQVKSLALVAGKFLYGVVSLSEKWIVVSGVLLVVCTACSLILLFSTQRNRNQFVSKLFFPLCWLMVPVLLAWVVSFAIPILQPKRVLYCLPAVFLIFAVIIDELWQRHKTWLAGVLAGVLITSQVISLYQYYTVAKYQREDWRGLTQQINSNFSPVSSTVVFSFSDAFAPWQWYNTQHFPTYATGTLNMDTFSDELGFKKLSEYDTIMVFDYLRDLSDPQKKIEQKLSQMGYLQTGQLDRANIGFVRIFQRKSATYASRN
jgi:uncharacterized membrane protein